MSEYKMDMERIIGNSILVIMLVILIVGTCHNYTLYQECCMDSIVMLMIHDIILGFVAAMVLGVTFWIVNSSNSSNSNNYYHH